MLFDIRICIQCLDFEILLPGGLCIDVHESIYVSALLVSNPDWNGHLGDNLCFKEVLDGIQNPLVGRVRSNILPDISASLTIDNFAGSTLWNSDSIAILIQKTDGQSNSIIEQFYHLWVRDKFIPLCFKFGYDCRKRQFAQLSHLH